MLVTPQELGVAALRLRNATPEGWDKFLQLLDNYTNDAMARCVSAGPGEVLGEQGKAQQCQALLRIFTECDKKPKQPTP